MTITEQQTKNIKTKSLCSKMEHLQRLKKERRFQPERIERRERMNVSSSQMVVFA